MPKGIPKLYAYAIQRGAHVIPQIHTTLCNPSCVFYADCANYEQNEPCMGFKLTENGSATRQILANLNENDRIFVERCLEDIPKLKDEQYKETLVKEVLRYLEPEQSEKPTIKRITKVYDGDKLFSTKEEELKTLEEPQTKQISLFNENWQISNENVRKPPKPPEPPPSHYDDRLSERVKEKLTQERQISIPSPTTIPQPQYPQICNPSCEFVRQCPYGNARNWNKPCLKREELYRNR